MEGVLFVTKVAVLLVFVATVTVLKTVALVAKPTVDVPATAKLPSP